MYSVSSAGDQLHTHAKHQIAFADDAHIERQIERQIAEARDRIAAARARTEHRESETRRAMRVEVAAARRAVAELEERHRAELETIRETTEREVARLRGAQAEREDADVG